MTLSFKHLILVLSSGVDLTVMSSSPSWATQWAWSLPKKGGKKGFKRKEFWKDGSDIF